MCEECGELVGSWWGVGLGFYKTGLNLNLLRPRYAVPDLWVVYKMYVEGIT